MYEPPIVDAEYDDQFDFKSDQTLTDDQKALLELDPEKIDFSTADPEDIKNMDQALKVLSYLKEQDKGTAEEIYYSTLMDIYGIEEEDPTILDHEEKMLVAGSFKNFAKYMFLVEYGFKFKNNWHHDYLCNLLEDLFLGTLPCPRIIINIPPRYSKTQLLIYFVAWTMGHAPDSEYIMIGYAKMLSEESSFKVRECLQNEKYQAIFGVELDNSSKAKDNFKTKKNGKVYATSTGGTLTGKGAGKLRKSWGGCIIADDPNNTLDAFSETQRNNANMWFSNTLLSRRNNMKLTPIIVIQQRVHENDISGYLLPTEEKDKGETGEEYTHIEIPAILNKEQLDEFNVPADSDTRLHGDPDKDEYPLWHYKIALEELRNMRDNLPVLTFFGQYQQKPFAQDGAIIKAKWIHKTSRPKPSEIRYRVFVLDTAQTVTKRSDFSVILVACVLADGTVFIEDIHRERMEAPDLADKVLDMFGKYKPRKIFIEYKSSGINLIQYLKREKVPMPIEPIPRNASAGDGDSCVRANGVSSYIKCGYVSVLGSAPWLTTFFHELMTFPTGTHDDQVDTLVDLVAKEVVPGGDYISPMNISRLPIKEHTYQEDAEAEPAPNTQDFLDQLLESGVNFRGKDPKSEDNSYRSWQSGLCG